MQKKRQTKPSKTKNDAPLLELAPSALKTLKLKEWDCEKITKKEIMTIAWRVYAK